MVGVWQFLFNLKVLECRIMSCSYYVAYYWIFYSIFEISPVPRLCGVLFPLKVAGIGEPKEVMRFDGLLKVRIIFSSNRILGSIFWLALTIDLNCIESIVFLRMHSCSTCRQFFYFDNSLSLKTYSRNTFILLSTKLGLI